MSAEFPARNTTKIPSALHLYRISAHITGILLLLLCMEIIVKYIFGYELELGGASKFLTFVPSGTVTAFNLSTALLIVHGWFYVFYLFCDFRLWSLMRWPLVQFIFIALGGVIPFLSFYLEHRVARDINAQLASRAADIAAADVMATAKDNAKTRK